MTLSSSSSPAKKPKRLRTEGKDRSTRSASRSSASPPTKKRKNNPSERSLSSGSKERPKQKTKDQKRKEKDRANIKSKKDELKQLDAKDRDKGKAKKGKAKDKKDEEGENTEGDGGKRPADSPPLGKAYQRLQTDPSSKIEEQVSGSAIPRAGPKFAFGFTKGDKSKDANADLADGQEALQGAGGRKPMSREAVDALFSKNKGASRFPSKDDPQLRDRRSFTRQELCALVALVGFGFESAQQEAGKGEWPTAALSSALNPRRKLGLAEKAMLKALLDPAPPDFSLHPGQHLISSLGLVPSTKPTAAALLALMPPSLSTKVSADGVKPPPPPPGSTSLPAAAVAAAAATMPQKRIVPLNEWPAPSAEAVQEMLARFPQLDGHCRGSLINLPPQFALAILWDMDAKGGPEAIRDPQGFIFSAAQTLQRGAAAVTPLATAAIQLPVAGLLQMPNTSGVQVNFTTVTNQMPLGTQVFAMQ